ncbi:non-hydrolyzing UDP-N-acetylglucosamine 2-epimerase [Neobacillus sp. YIM B06451]|uniref:non-hydrolyzing UDP-N-acetylglucosamine 2-epimerase n=1 Tax=Neobacillus sp. YIM B06451 TaxID=3070994 RepID=UPI00292DF063|nr:UDP-N-acetylglucosamine 2-epimerase (non-hydrolyzing) [Neobacillus sp. YIM B06451]
MKRKLKVMVIFGTRPEAIKMAPLVNELAKHPDLIETSVTVTAQHREMLDQVLTAFSIHPDFDLNLMQSGQSLGEFASRSLSGLDTVIKKSKPDLVLVHGDTTTTFAATLAAFYNNVKVGHVEAGLRTFNKHSPFPEELNRQLTGLIADLHFAPTATAISNLHKENKDPGTLFLTGNTVIDALKTTVTKSYKHDLLNSTEGKRLILLTAHRRENLGKPMINIFQAVKRIAREFDDVAVVYPVHLNPSIQTLAAEILAGQPNIHLTDPLDVIDFHNICARSYLILTDSGGIQEEAPFLGVPVLILRDTTERPEGIEAGSLKLAGIEEGGIYRLTKELLTNDSLYKNMSVPSNVYGDGFASKRIVDAILHYFGLHTESK